MNLRKPRTLLLTVLLPALLFTASSVRAQEPQPGDVCPEASRFMRVAGPENPGNGHFLFCDSNLVWQPVMRFQSAGHVLFNSSGLPAAPLHVWGEAIIGHQGLACSGPTEGAIRYDSAGNIMELCDGSSWLAVSTGAGGMWTAGTGDDIYYDATTPQVGIGTASPDGSLDVEGGRAFLPALNTAPADGDLATSQWSLWQDEGNSELEIKARDSGGTIENYTLISRTALATSCSPAVNNTQTASMASAPGNSVTLSGYNAGSYDLPILVVTIAAEDDNNASPTVSSVTFGGTGMTEAVYAIDDANDKFASLYYLTGASGTGDIVVTISADVEAIEIGAHTLSCMAQQGPEATATNFTSFSNVTSLTTNITTATPGAYIVDSLEFGDNVTLSVTETGQNLLYQNQTPTSATSTGGASYMVGGSAGAHTMGWSATSGNRAAHVVAAFEAAASGTAANLALDDLNDVNAALAGTGDLLSYNGSKWVASSNAVKPAGGDRQIQFNNSGAFGADASLVYTADGRVGIGTATADATLHISGGTTSSPSVIIAPDTFDNSQNSSMKIGEGSGTQGVELFYDASNNELVFRNIADAATIMTVERAGNVGIGTTNPTGILNLAGDNATFKHHSYSNAANAEATYGFHRARGTEGGEQAVQNGDEVGDMLFFAHDGNSWESAAQIQVVVNGAVSDEAVPTDMYFSTRASSDTGPVERMRIDSDGNVGIGTTSPNVALDVVGDIAYTGTLTAVSDIRFKHDIKPLESPLKKLTSLRGLSYDKKTPKGDGTDHQVTEYGFAAQEVQKVFPALVRTAPDEMGTLSVNYIGLIAPMVEAMKEQQAQIEDQRNRLHSLERQNAALLRRLEALEAGGAQ